MTSPISWEQSIGNRYLVPFHPQMLSSEGYLLVRHGNYKGMVAPGEPVYGGPKKTYVMLYDRNYVLAQIRNYFKPFLQSGLSIDEIQTLILEAISDES